MWKYVAVNISRFGVEDQQNRGAARIQDYVKTKINAAERALWNELEAVVFADGSGSNEPNGLQNLIAAAPTTGIVHGLNRATYSWWRNQTKTASGAFSVYGISDIRNCLNNVTKYSNSEVKDIFMMTDQTTYEAYEDEMLEFKQFTNQTLVDVGMDHLVFRGRPIMWSPSAPAAKMYFINPNFLYCCIDPDYYMDMTDWKPIPDQVNDKMAQIVCTLQLTVTRPITQDVLTGITY